MKNCFSGKLIMILVSASLLVIFSAPFTYAWFTDSVAGKAEFTNADVSGELSYASSLETGRADGEPRIEIYSWTLESASELFDLNAAISSSEAEGDLSADASRNAAFSEWLSDSFSGDFLVSSDSATEKDLVFMRVILRNYSNIPIRFRLGLDGLGGDFEAAYAAYVYALFDDEGFTEDPGPFGQTGRGALRYVEVEGENGLEKWFECNDLLEPCAEDSSLEYTERAIWICAYLIDGAPADDVCFGEPVIEIIQADGEFAPEADNDPEF